MSAVPDEQSPEVGGLQNTATQFGASLGTALAGSILIASLTASFLSGIAAEPGRARRRSSRRRTSSSPAASTFISDAELESALEEAGVDEETTQAIVDENEQARLDGLRSALALLAIFGVIALFFTKRIPSRQPDGVAGNRQPSDRLRSGTRHRPEGRDGRGSNGRTDPATPRPPCGASSAASRPSRPAPRDSGAPSRRTPPR